MVLVLSFFFPIKVHNAVLAFRYQFSSVFHLIRAGLRVAKINGYNQYWILYSTYIKFRLLTVSVYSRILNVCKKLTGKMYSVKGILCSLIYKTYILLHVAKIKSFDRFGKAMFLL